LKGDPIAAKNSESSRITEKSNRGLLLAQTAKDNSAFSKNGGYGYLCLNHKSQGDNTAAFGSSSPPPTEGKVIKVTMSFGLALLPPGSVLSKEEWIKQAD
jgi:hypothetical protein